MTASVSARKAVHNACAWERRRCSNNDAGRESETEIYTDIIQSERGLCESRVSWGADAKRRDRGEESLTQCERRM